MIKFSQLVKFGLALVIMVAGLTPTTAAGKRYFDPRTGQWKEYKATSRGVSKKIDRKIVSYETKHRPGTILINTGERRAYFILKDGKAVRYGIGVARDGFEWGGTLRVTRKAEWPSWTPTASMRRRDPSLPRFMEGGPRNPMGARALYLGSTLYRLHGTNEPWSIGQNTSSGCIRFHNEDIIDLYNRVRVGTKVIVS